VAKNATLPANEKMPVLGDYCGDDTNNCLAGLQCDAIHCVIPQGLGGQCASDSGCQTDLACEGGLCTRRRGLGEACTIRRWPWSDCQLDALCNRDSLTCVFYKKGDDPEDEQDLYYGK